MLQCVAVCFGVLQGVAVCRRVLQSVNEREIEVFLRIIDISGNL